MYHTIEILYSFKSKNNFNGTFVVRANMDFCTSKVKFLPKTYNDVCLASLPMLFVKVVHSLLQTSYCLMPYLQDFI